MKIVSAEIYSATIRLSERHNTKTGWRPIILKLTTDEGLTGIGELGLAYGAAHHGGVGALRDFVEGFVIGMDPFEREKIFDTLTRQTFWGGACGPIVNGAMSAIDIACWDIIGKALDMPVWKLLGGKINDNLRTYASQTQFGWNDGMDPCGSVEEYAAAAMRAVDEGYDAIKVDPVMIDTEKKIQPPLTLKGALTREIVDRTVDRMTAIREAIGPDIDIILELHSLTSITGGQRLVEALEHLDLFMVEEAVNYNSALPARVLKQRMPSTRMTGGERIFTRWQFREYLEDGAFDMVQPDFCLVGGITEGKKVCDMAHIYEVTVQGHVCGTPISTAAALHVEASIPNFEIHEHHIYSTLEGNRNICLQDLQPVKGRFAVPDGPGLGVELNEEFMRKHSNVTTLS
ncbi:mandelate racemase/muconate lactonizing enzyme family protein [Sulfitobacter porphyrae]|uniref:Mandelate racemase/muconate lactonizing enzyme family protein n=1 Tax=Sulfitobacter porphyrae TaxID=1246864 RepID=A0ABW2BCG1_9RHOB|nr:racemase [Sulfitobacter porphyrae]